MKTHEPMTEETTQRESAATEGTRKGALGWLLGFLRAFEHARFDARRPRRM
jgi:hypothetical protein